MATAWAPSHATLFFSVPKEFEDPIKMGSIGGGFNFEHGVTTQIEFANEDKVFWNNEPIRGEVTITALNQLRHKFNIMQPVHIYHKSSVPIGYGLSTSGAGSIGTLLAANNLFDTHANKNELFQMAHVADVYHHTGLGSVIAQVTSNIELRLTQGAPGIGKVLSFPSNSEIFILLFGPLKTSQILTSRDQMQLVTSAGLKSVNKAKIIEDNFDDKFIQIGAEFTNHCGLTTPRVKSIQKQLRDIGENRSSMAMIGETLIVLPNNINNLISWLNENKIKYIKTRITNKVPHLI